MRRLPRRKNLNNNPKIVTVTPRNTIEERESVTPRKILPAMDRYRAEDIDLVHVGKYLVSLQPENCHGLDSLFADLETPADENRENNPTTFPANSYQTPPRDNYKRFLSSPPILPSPKKRRVLMAAPPSFYNAIPTLDEKNFSEEKLFKPILKPRNLNLAFDTLANGTTLA